MPIYRVTFQFSGGGVGWSETHLYNNSSTDFNTFRGALSAVAQLRANLLGNPYYVYAIRVSRYLLDNGSRAPRGVRIWKGDVAKGWGGWYNVNFDLRAWDSEPSNVAGQAIGYAGAGAPEGFQGNQNQTFLGGMPDKVVDENGAVFPGELNWGAAFNLWAGTLTKAPVQWGWGAQRQLGDNPINTITQNANGTVNITLKGALPGGLVVGTTYPVRIRAVNNGRSPLNGPALATLNLDNSFTTKEVIGIPTAQVDGNMRTYATVTTFVPYNSLELALRTVKHKRGKSPEAGRGRAPKRIRG